MSLIILYYRKRHTEPIHGENGLANLTVSTIAKS